MSKTTVAELQALPGVSPAKDAATNGFMLQQTMLRIRDPNSSLDFYTRILGMTLITKLDFPDMGFSLYFLAHVERSQIPECPVERARWMFSQPVLELTHNYGTESDPEFKGYASGNSDPGKGFGHIGITVPSVSQACARFDELGVQFVKRPNDGKMKNLAFIKDPDGYWVEILEAADAVHFVNWADDHPAAD